ncbi:FAD:protein FMN transferase [Bowmanella dokdonensis]|nr:FAD:protein FMN transferase [Bowmanella dokdonensis]
MHDTPFVIEPRSDHIVGRFTAMASPCELLIDGQDRDLATQLTTLAWSEARRIEHKYSRYRDDNLCHRINHSQGQAVPIDEETFRLLSFADTCYRLSDGLFDITSGVLRRVWKFDGSDNLPTFAQVNPLLEFVGWEKLSFDQHFLRMPAGFELDFGGIGKEYAVDSVTKHCLQLAPRTSVLVNFGGDIQVSRPRVQGRSWHIGIEDPNRADSATRLLKIYQGGLATSGDARRFLLKDGIRYSHILNPKTGFPVKDAPRSVTVAAAHCIQAGMLATLSLLQGPEAEDFLKAQQVDFWICR